MVITVREAVRRGGLSPVVADAGLGVGVAAGLLAAAVAGVGPAAAASPAPLDAGAVALAAAAAAAVAVRRRYPIAALLVLNAVPLVWFLGAYPGRLITLAPLIGCYTLAAHQGWRWGVAGAVPTALIQIIAIRVVLGDAETAGVVPEVALLVATAGSAGAAVGYNRAVLAATRARFAREARSREERGRRIAAEERLRIARELHDVFGHTMATISVQAGVGLHVIEQRPGQAREALTTIKKICDEGLTDVKTILGILRTDTSTAEEAGQPRAPRGGLDRLSELLDTAEAAGLRVELTVDGDPRRLPAPVDLAAYRIVQEALTNVLRHAGARTVRLTLGHEPARLLIRIHDDGPGTGADTHHTEAEQHGHGIDGMRERARALSGRLTAAPHPDGGFEVCAELPVPNPR
ncbi:sensor histidine kinase [Pseudonocardia xinjiangensis]|uniref:histidine kinase n=1 Tax=Pseudonocardia xinjiangensis TaxID=75289 RepID=A0ABX1RC05_9PSEU|nr:sensor histidine kinase [Pseudonocardia xinjiangensis]NMH77927.1 sensor histidine kinase [Pseudonocardia xinjiangensis]